MVQIKTMLKFFFQHIKFLYFSISYSKFSFDTISVLKSKITRYMSVLKSLSLSVKIVLILVLNLMLSFFLYTIIQQLFWFLVTLDLFFLLSLRPVFFIFSSYFLTCFFSFCLDDLINLKPTYYTLSCLLCVILLLITFLHKSFFVRIFASFSSMILRFFVLGDVMIAGGSIKISNTDNSIVKNTLAPYSLDYDFFKHSNRVIKTTNHNMIHEEKGIVEEFPSFAKTFYTSTYLEKEPHTSRRDLSILSNFTKNQGAAFTNLGLLHNTILENLHLNSTFTDFRLDDFFKTLKNHPSLLSQDTGAIANISSYQFRRENLLIIAGLLEHFGPNFSAEQLTRTFKNYDATLNRENPIKIDCYSPENEPFYLDYKLKKTPDVVVLVGNLNHNYLHLTSDRVIGTSAKSLQILATLANQDVDVNTLRKPFNNGFLLEGNPLSFTTNLDFLSKKLPKK
jgi:hypothetical protein